MDINNYNLRTTFNINERSFQLINNVRNNNRNNSQNKVFNKTILDTLREANTSITKSNMAAAQTTTHTRTQTTKFTTPYQYYYNPEVSQSKSHGNVESDDVINTACKNPINYNKTDMKRTSKWKKYMKKIHDFIMDEFQNVCLIKKTNNAYLYESTNQKERIAFECRFEGHPEKQRCTCIIYNDNVKLFHKTKKTPKRLYKELSDFIDYQVAFKKYEGTDLVPFVYSKKYQTSFTSSKADDIMSFLDI